MEFSNVKFDGVMSALVSCVDENENLKENTMRQLMNWHLKDGFCGFGGRSRGKGGQKIPSVHVHALLS